MMAYEMAQQLQQRGETVALVVLFDSENQAHRPDVSSSLESAWMRIDFLSQWLKLQCRTLWSFKPRELAVHVRHRVAFRLAWLRGRIWSIAYRIHLRAGWRIGHLLQNVEQVSAFVVTNYQPRPYDGRVLLFRRMQRPMGQYRDPEYGWGRLTSRLEIHDVPGNHIDMFLEPNVHALGGKLHACLLEAQENG